MRLVKQIRDDKLLRESFLELAVRVFDLSFKEWYESGFGRTPIFPIPWWRRERWFPMPQSMSWIWMEGQQETLYSDRDGDDRPAYRNLGLSRRLIQEIIKGLEGLMRLPLSVCQ